jgi:hypothetical protein
MVRHKSENSYAKRPYSLITRDDDAPKPTTLSGRIGGAFVTPKVLLW